MNARARHRFTAIFSSISAIGLGPIAAAACSDDSAEAPKIDAGTKDASDATVSDAPSADAGGDTGVLMGDPCGDVTGLQNGAAWPMVGGCPKRGGSFQGTGPSSTMIRFRAPAPAKGTSPIIGAAGNLYVATSDGRVVLIDLSGDVSDAGPPATSVDAGDGGDASTTSSGDSDAGDASAPNVGTSLAIAKDSVLVYGESNESAYALSASSGLSLWGTSLGATVISSPVVAPSGNVYFATNAGTLAAITISTGKIAWTAQTHDTAGTSAPAINDDQSVWVGSTDKHLYAFGSDGTPKFQFATSDAVVSTPAIRLDGVVIVGDMSGTLYAVDPKTGTEVWHVAVGSPIQAGCAVGFDATIYCSANDGKVHAFDRNGIAMWSFATSGSAATPIVDEVGVIYAGSSDTHLYAIEPSGKLRFAVSVFGPVRAQPAMGLDGAIYVTTDTEVVGVGP